MKQFLDILTKQALDFFLFLFWHIKLRPTENEKRLVENQICLSLQNVDILAEFTVKTSVSSMSKNCITALEKSPQYISANRQKLEYPFIYSFLILYLHLLRFTLCLEGFMLLLVTRRKMTSN